jgi:DNA-binding transcriptional regulator YhcF (GntR family)
VVDFDFDDERAMWRQALRHLRQRFMDGEFAPGTQAPSEARVAGEYGISRETARKALLQLCEEGMIELRDPRGKRRYVVVPPSRTRVYLADGDQLDVLDNPAGENKELGLGQGESLVRVERANGDVERYGARSTTFIVKCAP